MDKNQIIIQFYLILFQVILLAPRIRHMNGQKEFAKFRFVSLAKIPLQLRLMIANEFKYGQILFDIVQEFLKAE